MKKYTTRIIIGVIAVIALSLTLTNCNGRREPNASISAAETQAPSTEVTIESIESTTAPSTVSDETTAPEENTVPETTEAVENRVPADNAGSNTGSSNSGKPTQPVHTHSFVASVTKPTCTEKGYTTYTCFGCDYSYRDTYVTALDISGEIGRSRWNLR